MNEKVFFIIDGKELMLDKVLVEFNEMPIFFVCKYEQNYFISSCVNIEEERYLIAKVGLSNLAKMLHGKITMRNLILQSGSFWEIIVGKDFSEDVVTEKSLESILLDELPYEGEYLTLATKDLREYAEKIDAVLYGEGVWESEVSPICDEDFDMIINTIYENYEIALQNCYESIINNLKQGCFVCDDVDAYIKGVFIHRMEIDADNTKLKVKIDDNDKRSWAA